MLRMIRHRNLYIEHRVDYFRGQNVPRSALCCNTAILQNDQLVGISGSQIQVVQNHHHANAVLISLFSGDLQSELLMRRIKG